MQISLQAINRCSHIMSIETIQTSSPTTEKVKSADRAVVRVLQKAKEVP